MFVKVFDVDSKMCFIDTEAVCAMVQRPPDGPIPNPPLQMDAHLSGGSVVQLKARGTTILLDALNIDPAAPAVDEEGGAVTQGGAGDPGDAGDAGDTGTTQ